MTRCDSQCDSVTYASTNDEKYEGTVQNSALGEGTSIYVKTAKCIGGPAAGRIMRRLSTTAKLACCLA